MKPRSDPHENAEEQFSRSLAQKMQKAARLRLPLDQLEPRLRQVLGWAA